MRKLALISLLSNLSLYAKKFSNNIDVEQSMAGFMPWLITSLFIVGIFFWAMYKAIKTKNAKYGYLILFAGLFMLGILFI